MTDRVLLTMDDLETAVRANAAFEKDGLATTMVSSMDDVRAVLTGADPDVVILSGAVHERPAADLIAMARDRSVSTLGLFEPTEADPPRVAQRLGLTAWAVKPVDPADVVARARRLIERRRLQERTGIIGEGPAIQEVLVKIEQMAPVSSTVLVEGESGTGKELVAQGIHALSPRRAKPFVAVNCAALPETLLESELFGHEKGSFTGAAERRLGRFELANGGTLFLDEVGEMPLSTQVKLLRVLESQSFFRVGGAEAIRVDVRVVAATNRSLKEQVSIGQFRDDLFYRLNVLSIYLPPLRERKGDIPLLIRKFVRELSAQHGRQFVGLTAEAMQILVNAHWPGNVRELRNLIESMVVLAHGREVTANDIPRDVKEGGTRLLPMRVPGPGAGGGAGLQGHELEFIFRSLVELKLQIEQLRHRIDESPQRVEVIDMGRVPAYEVGVRVDESDQTDGTGRTDGALAAASGEVVYRPGMKMSEVERAAIEAALRESRGNRRRAAQKLEIGERTLYRKLKEFGLD
ncbi:MAG: sigma-54-dependent Fis family transcriptional regulator [Gemmatimonadetes bacterium]|nr:sigma-54-dependent Fis family transcriptional regulator [Gemmatimonadota bacterium]